MNADGASGPPADSTSDALRTSEQRLRLIIANAPIVLYAFDRDGVFTLSEGRGLQALGLAPGQVVGQSLFALYCDHPEIVACCRRALAGEEFSQITQVADLYYDSHYAPVRGADGAVREVIGVSTDITQRRQAEEALRASEAQLRQLSKMDAIGRLAGGVAHDFNNLLTAILGYGELLVAQLAAQPRLKAQAERILDAANRGSGLTRQLLAFSRRQPLATRLVDVNQVVGEALHLLRRLIGEDIELRFTPAADPAWVRADPVQLEQIIMNLVVNARDAMPDGGLLGLAVGVVTVGAADRHRHGGAGPGLHGVLTISDTGCGMDQATIERLFEPFFTTKAQGTGLGLSTVYGIVTQCGGAIQVASSPGRGTTFAVYLPLTGPEAAPLATPVDVPAGMQGDETVLLAEDEADVRTLAARVLRQHGYQVIEAADGAEALALAAAFDAPLHLLITDMVMPRLGGRDLADHLLALRPGLKVLFISGYTEDTQVLLNTHAPGSAFLQKPFRLAALVQRARGLLDQA